MNEPLPFKIDPEAAIYLRKVLYAPEVGSELALITVLRQADMIDGREHIWIDQEHFAICSYNIGQRPDAKHFEILGFTVSIVPATLKALVGRILTVRNVPIQSAKPRNVLVIAEPFAHANAGRASG